jgi:hypothetical protein
LTVTNFLAARGFCDDICSTKLGVIESSTASSTEQRNDTPMAIAK